MFKPVAQIQTAFRRFKKSSVSLITARPIITFFLLIALLFVFIAIGQYLRSPEEDRTVAQPTAKRTAVFDVASDTPRLLVPAEVRKESVVHVVALTSGIVTDIFVTPGKHIPAGKTLMTLTGDYQSGARGLQIEIAETEAELSEEQNDVDKKIAHWEREEIRKDTSLSDRQEKIRLKEVTQERLESKARVEISRLREKLAKTAEAAFRPKTFVPAIVESIRVRRGEFVASGTVLATLRTKGRASTLETLVSRETAALFDPAQPATLTIGSETLELLPTYFSSSETQDGLYPILFSLSEIMHEKITNGEFLRISLPLKAQTRHSVLVPIDAVYQELNRAWILVEENGKAESKTVVVSNVYGNFVEITDGLEPNARVILNRSVVAGESVEVNQ